MQRKAKKFESGMSHSNSHCIYGITVYNTTIACISPVGNR